MKCATPATGNGPLTGVYSGPQTVATQLVPDVCEPGWELVGETWQKGTALLAAESVAADLAAKRGNLSPATIATLRQWATDAASTTATAGNAVAVLNTMLPRLAVFFNRVADVMEVR